MKLVRPVTVTDSNLVSSNVAVSALPGWDVGTAYVIGDTVKVDTTHGEYEAVLNNTGVYPPDDVAEGSVNWLYTGPTNKWAMFDGVVGTETENTEEIVIEIEAGRINSVVLLNVTAASITVEASLDGDIVYAKTKTMIIAAVTNWYEFFYETYTNISEVAFTDLPSNQPTKIKITISGPVGVTVSCGICIIGNFRQLGESQWGLSGGIRSYSAKTVNQFGGYSVLKRPFAKRMTADVFMIQSQVNETYRLLSLYESEPAAWIAAEEFGMTIIYGFYENFDVVLSGPGGMHCNLIIQGLI